MRSRRWHTDRYRCRADCGGAPARGATDDGLAQAGQHAPTALVSFASAYGARIRCGQCGPRHFIADLLYEGIAALSGRATRCAWRAHVEYLSNQLLEVARRDPECRVLVAVNV
jgi:hypothetical protein